MRTEIIRICCSTAHRVRTLLIAESIVFLAECLWLFPKCPLLYPVSQLLLTMVFGASSEPDRGAKKQTEPLPYRLFPGSGALLIYYTRSLERIDGRFQFGYEFKKLKTERVAARCRRGLWPQSQNSLDSPAIAVIFKRSSLDGEQVHGINRSPACHILKHFPNFLSP